MLKLLTTSARRQAQHYMSLTHLSNIHNAQAQRLTQGLEGQG